MPLNLQLFINNGWLDELANCFTNSTDANILLTSIGFPASHRPNFNQVGSSRDYWYAVCEKINNGLVPGGFAELMAAAAQQLPGNKTFKPFALKQSPPPVTPVSPQTGNNIYPVALIGQFEAFISYSRVDQILVKCIAGELKKLNRTVWLDEWELIPGDSFVDEIEQVLAGVPAVVVFLGPQGFGPWHKKEVAAAYERAFRKQCRLIPVLLPGADVANMPLLLKTFTAMHINNCSDHVAIDRLAKAIIGQKP